MRDERAHVSTHKKKSRKKKEVKRSEKIGKEKKYSIVRPSKTLNLESLRTPTTLTADAPAAATPRAARPPPLYPAQTPSAQPVPPPPAASAPRAAAAHERSGPCGPVRALQAARQSQIVSAQAAVRPVGGQADYLLTYEAARPVAGRSGLAGEMMYG
jgi:hypothetical protein